MRKAISCEDQTRIDSAQFLLDLWASNLDREEITQAALECGVSQTEYLENKASNAFYYLTQGDIPEFSVLYRKYYFENILHHSLNAHELGTLIDDMARVLTNWLNPPNSKKADLLRAVKEHAYANYDDGWDIVVECYTDKEVLDAIGGAKTEKGAIRNVSKAFYIREHHSYRKDIEGTAF